MRKQFYSIYLFFLFIINSNGQICDTTFRYFNLNKPGSIKGTASARFVKKIDNYPKLGQQIWFYEIKSGTQYAISHVVFGYTHCVNVLGMGEWEVYDSLYFKKYKLSTYLKDPTTNELGYKFDTSFIDDSSRKYYLIVDKIYLSDSIKVTMKGGGVADSKYLCGPSENCNILPIELIYFNVQNFKTYNILKWSTATEYNNEKFEIEKLDNGNTWIKLDEVKGAGMSVTQMNYSYTDYNPNTTDYYRIKQIDFDGTFSYSPIVKSQTIEFNDVVEYYDMQGNKVNQLQFGKFYIRRRGDLVDKIYLIKSM